MNLPFKASWLYALLATAGILSVASAQEPSTGYTAANAQGCKVWVPLQLHSPEYVPRYVGACKGGIAAGKGHLEWLSRYSEMKVKTAWDGYFQNGVYVGDIPFNHEIEPRLDSNDYLVRFGTVKIGDVILFAKASNEGKMDLCASSTIGISLNSSASVTDDSAIKQGMMDAATRLQALCPSMRYNAQINIYTEPYKVDIHGTHTMQTADANITWQTMQLSGYSNRASNDLRNKQAQSAQSAKMADTKKRFDDFSHRNGITAWVTTTQLDENPFKFEGKVVGVVVQLDRMLTPDTALVTNGLDYGDAVQLHGITPDFPDHTHTVLLAAKVGKREPMTGSSDKTSAFTGITRIDSATCIRNGCYDWMGWDHGSDRIVWGEPYPPTH